ncbi:Putative vegetative incompatibility HET containing-domain protein [Podospora comata]|uniref:Vegetative incompatibility HET containing-domain protein n=1 Tax=Podospora comata TaxID=48703 RepID=A0ABY6SDW2_PODCO|nr:Putative vegetative incompatibility HET containing-domain protein [Podospora comata]
MWLINCQNYQLEQNDIDGPNAIPYCILSHTWGDDEVTFQDMQNPFDIAVQKKGFEKIKGMCELTLEYGHSHAWVDTCCIDKTSSAELTESINSMFHWYQKAALCVVYLEDFALTDGQLTPTKADLQPCRWFTRGWTLQELVAPRNIIFHDCNWTQCGSKVQLLNILHRITSIDITILRSSDKLNQVPVAQKMSWAAKRNTTRIEDMAYCLLGIFGIHMPLIYGEREKAFLRLQEHIAQKTNDMSLFAWQHSKTELRLRHSGILARHPSWFVGASDIKHWLDPVIPTPSWIITNTGLELHTALDSSRGETGHRLYLCCTSGHVDHKDEDPPVFTIWLRKIKSSYVRYQPSWLSLTPQSQMRFGKPSLVRIATSLTPAEGIEANSLYFTHSDLLYPTLKIQWECIEAYSHGFSVSHTYYPEHLWDIRRECFLASSSPRFVGVVEITMSAPTGDSTWEATCYVVCGLRRVDSQAAEGTDPLCPWAIVLQHRKEDDTIEGLDSGYTRGDLVNPYRLSTLGITFRSWLAGNDPPSRAMNQVRYGDKGHLTISASVLAGNHHRQLGDTIVITVTPVLSSLGWPHMRSRAEH